MRKGESGSIAVVVARDSHGILAPAPLRVGLPTAGSKTWLHRAYSRLAAPRARIRGRAPDKVGIWVPRNGVGRRRCKRDTDVTGVVNSERGSRPGADCMCPGRLQSVS